MRFLGPVAFAAALVWLAVVQVFPVQDHVTTSFVGYWIVAKELAAGTPVVALYDDAFLATRLDAEGFSIRETFLGPPTLALTLYPLAHKSYVEARHAWLWGFSLPCIVVSLLALRPHAGRWGWPLAALLLVSPGVVANLLVGQVYGVILALHVAVATAMLAGRPLLAALGTATMIAMRGWYGLPLVLGWAWRREWGAAGASVVGATLFALVALPWTGVGAWVTFVSRQLGDAATEPWAGTPAFQTLRSFVLHLTTPSPLWGPDPVVNAPWLAPCLLGALALALVLAVGRRLRDVGPLHAVALLSVLEIVLSPYAQEYHYTLAILPVMVAAGSARGWGAWAALGVGTLLLLVPWDVQDPSRMAGWASLLAYPRLYGIVLVGAVLASGGERVQLNPTPPPPPVRLAVAQGITPPQASTANPRSTFTAAKAPSLVQVRVRGSSSKLTTPAASSPAQPRARDAPAGDAPTWADQGRPSTKSPVRCR